MIEVVELMNAICKAIFIFYAWLTMLRINAYIKKESDK